MWTTPSATDALLTDQERNSLQVIQGAADKLQGILDKEIAAARGAILAGGGRLDQEGTLPDQILPDVLALVAWRYLIGYPALNSLQTPERRAAYDDARATLRAIARGAQKVELPAAGQALDLSAPVGQVQWVGRGSRRGRAL